MQEHLLGALSAVSPSMDSVYVVCIIVGGYDKVASAALKVADAMRGSRAPDHDKDSAGRGSDDFPDEGDAANAAAPARDATSPLQAANEVRVKVTGWSRIKKPVKAIIAVAGAIGFVGHYLYELLVH